MKLNEKADAAGSRNGKTVSATLENRYRGRNVLLATKGTEVTLRATSPNGMELHITLASMTLTDQRKVVLSSDQIIKPSTMVRPRAAAEGAARRALPRSQSPGRQHRARSSLST